MIDIVIHGAQYKARFEDLEPYRGLTVEEQAHLLQTQHYVVVPGAVSPKRCEEISDAFQTDDHFVFAQAYTRPHQLARETAQGLKDKLSAMLGQDFELTAGQYHRINAMGTGLHADYPRPGINYSAWTLIGQMSTEGSNLVLFPHDGITGQVGIMPMAEQGTTIFFDTFRFHAAKQGNPAVPLERMFVFMRKRPI